jgi:hypothetical protein
LGGAALKYLQNGCFIAGDDAQDLQELVERGVQLQSFSDEGDEGIDRDGDPDLGFPRVPADAEKALVRRCC